MDAKPPRVRTAAQVLSDINMILARRIALTITDRQCIELISEVMDSPDAVALALDLLPPD